MNRKPLTWEMLIDKWLQDYHGTTLKYAYAAQPWTDSRDFYARYPVTQEQHDEWREWLVKTIMKHYRMRRKVAERNIGLIYLNTSPIVKK
jgi:hypothetical protein